MSGLLLVCVPAFAIARDFVGTLSPQLTPYLLTTTPCIPDAVSRKGLSIPAAAALYRCHPEVFLVDRSESITVLLVEPGASAMPFAYVDSDRKGFVTEADRVAFLPVRRSGFRALARVHLRPFQSAAENAGLTGLPDATHGAGRVPVPMDLGLPSDEAVRSYPSLAHALSFTVNWFVAGRVVVDRQAWHVRIDMFPGDSQPRFAYGRTAFSRRAWASEEEERDRSFDWREQVSNGESAVVRLGRHYVSIAEADLASGRLVLRERDVADYRRLELEEGMQMPDFSFIDLDGRSHRLADFRGRTVLLNFWYPGCSPCTDEFPWLRQALDRFTPDRVTIVGLSTNPFAPAAEVRQAIGAARPGWVESDPWNVSRLTREWFHVTATPSLILIGPDGRVKRLGISRHGRSALRGADLLTTLGRSVPGSHR